MGFSLCFGTRSHQRKQVTPSSRWRKHDVVSYRLPDMLENYFGLSVRKQQTCLCVLVSHRRQLVPFTTGPSMYIRSWARLLCPSARVFSRSAPCVHAPNLSSWAAVNSNKNLTVAQSRPLQTQDVISGAEPRQMSAVAAP